MEKEVTATIARAFPPDKTEVYRTIPATGVNKEQLLQQMQELFNSNTDPYGGRLFAYSYSAENQEFKAFQEKAHNMFINTNGLNAMAFPSLRKFEVEVVAMTASLLHGPQAVGTMTSGGTESILMAVKACRGWGRTRHITEPELILPASAHPAFYKACEYLSVKPIVIPLGPDFAVRTDLVEAAITRNTIAIVGSAPSYPQGVMDPIEELGQIALRHKLLFHVDACIGGWILPWLEQLGQPVPLWDFRCPGVSSISADVHKYGYASKGASTVLYADDALRREQFYAYAEWPGGLFVSPSMLGTRPGGVIAAAWASIVALGQDGYLNLARNSLETTQYFIQEINSIPGLYILGNPVGTLISFASKTENILAVADVMEQQYHWTMERQQNPSCIHCTVNPAHSKVRAAFVADLRAAVAHVAAHHELATQGSAAMYGMVANIPAPEFVEDFLITYCAKLYK